MRLTPSARKRIPTSEFAGPDRSYPLNDESHARNALARASGKSIEPEIRAKVHARFPDIGKRPHIAPSKRR